MSVKTFWLYIYAMILSIDAQESIFSYISKNKMPYIVVSNVAALTILSFFVYKYMVHSEIVRNFKSSCRDIQQSINNFIIINETKPIYEKYFSKETIRYPMSCNENITETLLYPINLHANSLVRQTDIGWSNAENIIPKSGEPCFIDTQWWVHKETKVIRLSIDTIFVNCYINCILPETLVIPTKVKMIRYCEDEVEMTMPNDLKEHFMMDGKNEKNCVVIGAVNSDKTISAIFADMIYVKSNTSTYKDMKPFCVLNGLLLTVMMHPHKDIIAYSLEKEKQFENDMQYALHIVENVCSRSQDNITELDVPIIDYYSIVDFGIKKITPFSGSTYLFLTLQGELGMCWPTKNEKKENSIDFLLKKTQSRFIDFTPDTSVVKSSGFMPHWAFLTDKGEIFLCDFLLSLKQTTLFFVKQADPCTDAMHEKFDKIYYHNGHCGVLYKEVNSFPLKDVPYTRLITYS